MEEKLDKGEAIDISSCKRTPEGHYVLKEFVDEVDYCNAKDEHWIWSIGKNYKTGQILASTGNIFYENPDYKCLFLR